MNYYDLPLRAQVKLDALAYRDFEQLHTEKLPTEIVNILYFPAGGSPFLVDLVDNSLPVVASIIMGKDPKE